MGMTQFPNPYNEILPKHINELMNVLNSRGVVYTFAPMILRNIDSTWSIIDSNTKIDEIDFDDYNNVKLFNFRLASRGTIFSISQRRKNQWELTKITKHGKNIQIVKDKHIEHLFTDYDFFTSIKKVLQLMSLSLVNVKPTQI